MGRILFILVAAFILSVTLPSIAQDKKCEGPAELCAQILELQDKLEQQKQASTKNAVALSEKQAVEVAALEQEKSDRVAKIIAFAAALAAALKVLVSLLNSWKGYFKTDRQKAGLRIALIVIGLLLFLATNIGFGLPWWQACILAMGGPGSIVVHELSKLVEVFRGQKKYEEVDPDGDPTTSPATDEKANPSSNG